VDATQNQQSGRAQPETSRAQARKNTGIFRQRHTRALQRIPSEGQKDLIDIMKPKKY